MFFAMAAPAEPHDVERLRVVGVMRFCSLAASFAWALYETAGSDGIPHGRVRVVALRISLAKADRATRLAGTTLWRAIPSLLTQAGAVRVASIRVTDPLPHARLAKREMTISHLGVCVKLGQYE